ncbi:MAG TPA: hypothetical protein VFT65_04670 [Candidatus Angelobacter sp.]|nr:hypothetical protein [Candidatus Angelobacter sp.]
MRAKRTVVSLALMLMAFPLISCVAPPPRRSTVRRTAPEPCRAPVQAIRYTSVNVLINSNYTYNPKDASGGRVALKTVILDRLNQAARPDGNSFNEPNGQPTNVVLNFSLNNDGQDHFTGSMVLTGWGWPLITTQSTQYTYSDPIQLTNDLTDKVYGFFRNGWHESRPNCH